MMTEDRIDKVWQDDARMQAALDDAFRNAVRRHRAANVPMVMWEDGEVREISPFDIPLPDDPTDPPMRRAQGGAR
jgi:hypothetical protein